MKLFITTSVILINVLILSCAKTRTCDCKHDSTTTKVTTPRSSAQPSTSTSTSSGDDSYTGSKLKKKDLVRLYNCNSRTETSVNTSTSLVTVTSVTSVSGFTYNTYTTYTADVVSTNQDVYTCEIK